MDKFLKKQQNSGQSFVELIAALVVVSIVLTALVGLITRGLANSRFSRDKTLATSYAQQGIEWLRSERDQNWASFYVRSGSNWCLAGLSWSGTTHSGSCAANESISGTIFRRDLLFNRVSTSVINATVSVSWEDSGVVHRAETTTTFTNWKGNP